MSSRENQILCGLFLSKFDKEALIFLDFNSFTEAFNVLGYGLGARPASIKNYRDEFDPLFENRRKGWRNRPLRTYCEKVLNSYGGMSLNEMGGEIRKFVFPDGCVDSMERLGANLERGADEGQSTFAKRLLTGRAAEQYFKLHWVEMPAFSEKRIVETTMWGCGFDFKIQIPGADEIYAVEVKGLRGKAGLVTLTDLEHQVAKEMRESYFLVLVRNFADKPFHTIFRDPVRNYDLNFEKKMRTIVQVTWNASV